MYESNCTLLRNSWRKTAEKKFVFFVHFLSLKGNSDSATVFFFYPHFKYSTSLQEILLPPLEKKDNKRPLHSLFCRDSAEVKWELRLDFDTSQKVFDHQTLQRLLRTSISAINKTDLSHIHISENEKMPRLQLWALAEL